MIISKKLIQEVINESAKTGCDFVEVFLEDTISHSVKVVGGKVEASVEDHTKGIGLRLALGSDYVYGYTNSLDKKSLLKLAQDLSSRYNGAVTVPTPLGKLQKGKHHKVTISPKDVTDEMRVEKVMEIYNASRSYSPLIIQSTAMYSDEIQNIMVAKSDGRFVEDQRVHTRVYSSAIASDSKSRESGSYNPGMAMGFEIFDKLINTKEVGEEASRMAIVNLKADYCPAGEMPVIIENGFGGVIFHEAVGHSLEATSVARNSSVFCGKLNTKVAHNCVNAYDDGTLENEWGSSNFDDEGNKQKRRQLIKNGVLVSYMIDELNARKMKSACTNSGRRESYKYAPTSRMSNTFIAPGKSSLEDMLKDIKFGLYAKSLGGGSVNPATGDYNFAVNEGYIIRNGKIEEAVKGATLVGNGRDTLSKIIMVGPNLLLGQGMCGSMSGSIPVNVGQPAIKVSSITVGGRKKQC